MRLQKLAYVCHQCKSWPTNAIVEPPMQELHSRKLRKNLVHEINAQCSHRAMKTWWTGPPRCSHMPGYQRSQGFIHPTSGCWFMSSWKSPQNVVQGHLVTFGPGEKNQMEQHNCMSLDTIGVYGKGLHGNTTNSFMVDLFVEMAHQCKSCIQGNWEKP